MKSKWWNIVFIVLLGSLNRASAQNNIDKYIMRHQISKNDSIRLIHDLIGFGLIEGKGEFVKNRRLYLDSALILVPWCAEFWHTKGMMFILERKYDLGMPFIDSAVKYDEEGFIGRRGYLECIFTKSCRASINDFRKAKDFSGQLKGDIEDHSYDFYIALCHLQLNQFDSAGYLLHGLISSAGNAAAIHYLDLFYLGITYFEKDDFPKAMEYFDSCLVRYNQFSDAEFYKAWCLSELNKQEQALSLMQKALTDFEIGYTINDDNARYEPYPYQINKYYLQESLEIFRNKLNKNKK